MPTITDNRTGSIYKPVLDCFSKKNNVAYMYFNKIPGSPGNGPEQLQFSDVFLNLLIKRGEITENTI